MFHFVFAVSWFHAAPALPSVSDLPSQCRQVATQLPGNLRQTDAAADAGATVPQLGHQRDAHGLDQAAMGVEKPWDVDVVDKLLL